MQSIDCIYIRGINTSIMNSLQLKINANQKQTQQVKNTRVLLVVVGDFVGCT